MPRGASPKREREYEELKHKFKRAGRYKGRVEEVASRIINKQRAAYGETKGEKRKDREGRSPDRGLPISNYQHLKVGQIESKLDHLSQSNVRKIRDYERSHKARKTLLKRIDQKLKAA
jgi:hypothetical protein